MPATLRLITRAGLALAVLGALALPGQAASEVRAIEQRPQQAGHVTEAAHAAQATPAAQASLRTQAMQNVSAAPAAQNQDPSARHPSAQPAGRLYRVKRGEQLSYLFGTVHVGEKSFFPLAPEVARALADASELVLELDTRANDAFQAAVLAHGSYRDGDDIHRHLQPDTLARLTVALHEAGIALNSVAHLKPWLLANILLGLELHRHGYDRTHGVETFLLADAARRGTAVTELESATYQLALFDTLTHEESERYLLESLRELSDGTSLRKARTILHAWRSGDPAALDAAMADLAAQDSIVASFTRATLLGRRNPEMAARIERIMDGGRTAFVGVGLLHLLGADGLPQLLAQRGYHVERVH